MHRPPLLPGKIPGTHFCERSSRPHGRRADCCTLLLVLTVLHSYDMFCNVGYLVHGCCSNFHSPHDQPSDVKEVGRFVISLFTRTVAWSVAETCWHVPSADRERMGEVEKQKEQDWTETVVSTVFIKVNRIHAERILEYLPFWKKGKKLYLWSMMLFFFACVRSCVCMCFYFSFWTVWPIFTKCDVNVMP